MENLKKDNEVGDSMNGVIVVKADMVNDRLKATVGQKISIF